MSLAFSRRLATRTVVPDSMIRSRNVDCKWFSVSTLLPQAQKEISQRNPDSFLLLVRAIFVTKRERKLKKLLRDNTYKIEVSGWLGVEYLDAVREGWFILPREGRYCEEMVQAARRRWRDMIDASTQRLPW